MKTIAVMTGNFKLQLHNIAIHIVILFVTMTIAEKTFSRELNSEIKVKYNTLRLNITNPLIFGGKSWILGYERILGNHQSFSVNLGQFSLPPFTHINTDSIQSLSSGVKSRGYSISADYRFYLANENKYNAPHGLYIGPYFSFNHFDRKLSLNANTASFTGQLDADFTFRAATLGFQLGYQFIFWDKLTLDLILFGPGISSYKVKNELSTSLDPDQEEELFTKINNFLGEKIPGYDLVIKPGSFEKNGIRNTTSFGYRYVVMVGFRF
jgi:hypothetical protein